jgi:sirohydrochlorin cobaltochelatase
MEPGLPDAVAKLALAGHRSITIAPLFMAQGGHLKHDLPKILDALRADYPKTEITLLPAIGDVDAIVDAIAGWLVGATAR